MSAPGLLLRGGRVIDPAQGLDGSYDVLVRDGRIAAVGAGLAPDGATLLDVTGQLVLPGLIDVHVHCFKGLRTTAADPDLLGVSRGATTIVDTGTSGCSTFSLFHDHIMQAARTRVLAYVNLSTLGSVVGPHFANLGDPRLIDPEGIARVKASYPERLIGIKMMATSGTVGPLGLEPLRRGRAVADEVGLPLLVHIGESFTSGEPLNVQDVVELLRPDDTVTHMYTAQPGGVLDANNRLQPAVREARDRGVRFDIGHGANNFNFVVAQRLLDQDFRPNAVGTDLSNMTLCGPVYDLPTTMSKLLMLDFPLRDVIALATSQAAELIGKADELGSLAVGREADISVLRLEEREWTATDSQKQQRGANVYLEPVVTVRAGEMIEPRPPDGP
jgi:dihydroorotase